MCGFIKPPGSEIEWHIRMHGAFEIPHEILGIKHTDQSCHQEVWIHLLHVNARLVGRASRNGQHRRPTVRKGTIRATTSRTTWPSTQEIHLAIRVRKRDNSRMAPDATRPPTCSASDVMSAAIRSHADASRPPRCSASESSQSGNLSCCPCVMASFSLS